MVISQKNRLLRENLCMKVALKVSVHPQFKTWFRVSKPRKVNEKRITSMLCPLHVQIVSPKWEEMLIRLYPQFA